MTPFVSVSKSEHDKQEFFSIGREEDPVCCSCARREQEARMRTTDMNSSQEDKEKTLYVVIIQREIKRRTQAQETGFFLKMIIRRPCSSCLHSERTRGALKHDKRELFSFSISFSLLSPPPPSSIVSDGRLLMSHPHN